MLEIKVVMHGHVSRLVAVLHIIQTAQAEGGIRNYGVKAMRVDMGTNEPVHQVGIVERHDRNEPVWTLIKKAIEALEPMTGQKD